MTEQSGSVEDQARRERVAESIIKREGFTFALAVVAKSEDALREARGYLKAAIIRALEREYVRN